MMHMGRKETSRMGRVRTTVTLDPDVATVLEELRRESGQGMSEVLNDAVRAGTSARDERRPFVQRTSPIGITGPVCTGEIIGMDDDQRFPAAG